MKCRKCGDETGHGWEGMQCWRCASEQDWLLSIPLTYPNNRFACCPEARQSTTCRCQCKTLCPVHGGKCHGSHE